MAIRNTMSTVAALSALFVGAAWAQDSADESSARQSDGRTFEQSARDAWIDGKLEAVFALNRHLNPFTIDTHVDNGMVTLQGTVQSDIDRDLAEELAKGIEGVTDVENELQVDPREAEATASNDNSDSENRAFGQWVDDATTTAAVKSKLMANSNVKGSAIDVDTRYDVVTLRGEVASSEERDLAEQLASNTGDVESVRNELTVQNDS